MSGHDSWGSNRVVCLVWCMVLNVVDDDDDDVAIACRESRSERMQLSSRPYFLLRLEFAASSA